MPKKPKKQADDYWDQAFEEDQNLLTSPSANPASTQAQDAKKGSTKKQGTSTAPKATEAEKDKSGGSKAPEAPAKQGGGATLGGPPPSGATTLGGDSTQQSADNKKKKKKKPGKKEGEDEGPSTAVEDKKESTGAPTPSPAPSSQAPAVTGTQESSNEPTEGEQDSKKKKGAKEPATKKKGGLSKKQLEMIEKMRQDEERRKREAEEALKRQQEEEEARRRQEEEDEKIRQEEKAKRKEKEKEKKERKKELQQKEKLELLRKQFGGTLPIEAEQLPSTEESKKKKVVYENKKKKKKPEDLAASTGSVDSTKSSSPSPSISPAQEAKEVKPPEPPKESWEEEVDDWEQIAEKKKPTPTPKPSQPAPAPAVVSTNENVLEKQESKAVPEAELDEDEKKKRELAGKELRSPICCILGHVDTGKTKLLDKIRHTNVQEGEAGGITQQIGATFFPLDTIRDMTAKLNQDMNLQYKVPGLLIIDTPGHESFTNLRNRGSSLCDIAILVVDIMHGLEPQTIESIGLLKMRKTPFIVALNKVDRIYGWKPNPNSPFQKSLNKQEKNSKLEFEQRANETITYFAEQGLNAALYYKNKDFRKVVSMVPTSAITGEGVPDLLMLLVQLTQTLMTSRLLYTDVLQCTVLEVKVVEGLGHTVDVILVNGVLHEGDTIVLCGLQGPIVTTIRGLLTPQPLKELRIKGQYIHHKEIKGAMGVKVIGQHLESTIAGGALFRCSPNDDLELLKKEVMRDLDTMMKKAETVDLGVYVQASTLGSLEALLEFLKQSKIPVSAINIGPVNKKDVMKASTMVEKAPEYAVILAFDVKVSKEAREVAEEMKVTIFTADIIYHLFDAFTAHMEKLAKDKRENATAEAVFPCRLRIYPEHIFNKRDPIVLGVEIMEGILKIGTPICVRSQGSSNWVDLGKVTSIEENHKALTTAKKGQSVAVKIEQDVFEEKKAYGRHFTFNDELFSKITRKSLDLLKENFREELEKEDVVLLAKLKAMFNIK